MESCVVVDTSFLLYVFRMSKAESSHLRVLFGHESTVQISINGDEIIIVRHESVLEGENSRLGKSFCQSYLSN